MARPLLLSTIAILLLTLCCRTASLLTVSPTYQEEYSPRTVNITCHFTGPQCSRRPQWSGPAVNSDRARYTLVNPGVLNLTITNIQDEDEGDYHCRCGERTSVAAVLVVNHFPSFENVSTNQSFQRGDTAYIRCLADPGDPAQTMFWQRNGNVVPNSASSRLQKRGQALIIENIDENDAGIYTCAFNSFRLHSVDINVAVEPRITVFPDLPFSLNVTFGQPLHLECRTTPPAVSIYWMIKTFYRKQRINNRTIHLEHEDLAGQYTCIAITSTEAMTRHSITVEQTNIPLRLAEPKQFSVAAVEGDPLHLHSNLQFLLENSNLSFQWKKSEGGRMINVHRFDSRITYNISRRNLRIRLDRAQIDDKGTYQLTISNEYGNDTLTVKIKHVGRLERTNLTLKFGNIPCDLLKEYSLNVSNQVRLEYCEEFCDDVKIANHSVECLPDGTALLSLTLLSQAPLTGSDAFSVALNGNMIGVTVCESDGECSPTVPAVKRTNPDESNEPTVISSVVVTVFVLLLVIVALLLTVLITRCRQKHYCNKHIVDREPEAAPEMVVVVQRDPCTGYMSVNRNAGALPQDIDPSVTPVCQPFLPQPQGLAAKPRRPQHLMFRSLSYQGTRRTPLRTV